MKKQIKSGFFVFFGALSIVVCASAQAATIPPGNPFYSFQNAVRSLRRGLTFNPVGKAFLELRLTNERMSDIEQVLRAPYEESSLETAFAAYRHELDALSSTARGITNDRVLDGMVDIVIRHGMSFDDLIVREEAVFGSDLRDQIEVVKKDMAGLLTEVFGERAGAVMRAHTGASIAGNPSPFKELRAAEIITALEIQTRSVEFTKDSERLKDDLIIAFVGAVKRGDALLEELPGSGGDELLRFQALDEARGKILDLETRNALTIAREHALNKAKASRRMTARAVREAIDYARIMAAAGIRNEQITYFIEQAEKFLADNAYDIAFQHAVSANIVVNKTLLLSAITKKDLREDIAFVKKQYDAAQQKSAFIEKRIAAIADMIGRASAAEIIAALREVKFALAVHK